jgi:dolichol kinase
MTTEPRHLRVEISRKAIHLTTGLIPLTYAWWDHRTVILGVLAAMSCFMLALEWLRRRSGRVRRLFNFGFDFMLRSHEQGARWLGATHYCLAALLCVALFPQPVAVLAILYLAIGDTVASLVGKAWGRIGIGKKTLEGTVAFGLACSALAFGAHALNSSYPLGSGIAAAWAAAFAELLIPRLDDNWTIPVAAALTMALLG